MLIFIGLMLVLAPFIGQLLGLVLGAVIFAVMMVGTFVWMLLRAFIVDPWRNR